jgi:hypothetical protein
MGALCPKPKKDDNWSEDSKNLLEEIARNLCEDDEQCARMMLKETMNLKKC